MHVVLVSPAWPLGHPNGIVTYVHHLRGGLTALGHRVSVLAFQGAEERGADGAYLVRPSWSTRVRRKLARWLHRSQGGSDFPARALADSLRRLHARHPIDIVEMEESFGWFAEVQQALPVPIVVKLHGPAFLSLVEEELAAAGSADKIVAERTALRQALFITSPCHDTLARTQQDCRLTEDWGCVIPNPIVMDPQAPLWQGAAAEPQTLLFVGRFDKRKGGDLVIHAFHRLLTQRPNLKLLFVGPDPGVLMEDGRRVRLQGFVEAVLPPALAQRVQAMGRLDPAAIARLRCQAAVTLVCSRWDNQPNTALEALLQGCPVVAFDAGGVAEVVRHGQTGRLARAGDLDDFARQVAWMLDHPEAAAALGAAGRSHVEQAHGVASVAQRTANYYASVRALRGDGT